MSPPRTLTPAEHRDLPRLAGAAGISLDALRPPGWQLPEPWWTASDLRIRTRGVTSFCLDRGWSFDADWVREVWIVAPQGRFVSEALRFAQWLFATCATHLRWRVRMPMSPAEEGRWERCHGEIIAWWRDAATVIYQLDPQRRSRVYHGRRGTGLTLGPPRPSELSLLARWTSLESVYRPLGYGSHPTGEELAEYLFPGSTVLKSTTMARILSIRRHRQLVGIAFDHSWDYTGDSIRELDLALPGLRASPGTIADCLGLLMHATYERGAAQTLANLRAGATGRGFPRLFARLGASDITDILHAQNAGQQDRRYYAATASEFYASPVGRFYAAA